MWVYRDVNSLQAYRPIAQSSHDGVWHMGDVLTVDTCEVEVSGAQAHYCSLSLLYPPKTCIFMRLAIKRR